jgi:hypothetical protein
MLKMAVLEPMMADLQDKLFGKEDKNGKRTGGVVSAEEILKNPAKAAKTVATAAQDFFNEQGSAMLLAGREFYEAINSGLGGILTNPNQKTLSASIQGTSEQTSDLLAGYVATLIQDAGANRIMIQHFPSEEWPKYIEDYASGMKDKLTNIDSNVGFILAAITANGELFEEIAAMRTKLDNITSGVETVYIN